MDTDSRYLTLKALRSLGASYIASENWRLAEQCARAFQQFDTGSEALHYVDFQRAKVSRATQREYKDATLHLGTNMVASGDGLHCPDWTGKPDETESFRRRVFTTNGTDALILSPARVAASGLDVIDLTHVWSRNWFHFLIEVVSQFAAPEVMDSGAKIAINRACMVGTFRQALDMLADEHKARLVPTSDWGRVECKALVQPRREWAPSYHPTKHDCPSLDMSAVIALYRRAWPNRRSEGRKIVLRRPATSVARCTNQDTMISHFTGLGFAELSPEEMSFSDQARAFYDADMIVGVSGAAFANLVFCRPGTRVVCARSGASKSTVYQAIADALDLDFSYFDAEQIAPSVIPDYGVFRVDPQAMADQVGL